MGISETLREIRGERIDSSYRGREPSLPKANAITRASERLRELTSELARVRKVANASSPNPYVWNIEQNINDGLLISAAIATIPVHHCSGTCEQKWHRRTVSAVREALEERVANGGLDTCTGRVIVSLAKDLGVRPSDDALAAQKECHRARVMKATERLRALAAELTAARAALDHAQALPEDTVEMLETHREWMSDYSAALDADDWTKEDDERLGELIHGRAIKIGFATLDVM